MNKILTERHIRKIIQESIRKVLSEANNNLDYHEFLKDMRKMGFEPREGEGSSKVFHNPKYRCDVTVHVHSNGSRVQADSLRQVKKELQDVGWFDSEKNRNIFPYDKWQFNRDSVVYDNTAEIVQKEIDSANAEYKEAIIYPIFPQKNSICALTTSTGVNLCRSYSDRRPLLDRWFNRIECENEIYYIVFDNYETWESEYYQIYPNGIGTTPILRENRNKKKNNILREKRNGKFNKRMVTWR